MKHREWEQIAPLNCWCAGITNGGMAPDILTRCGAKRFRSLREFLRVADSYAALTDARPFRPALTEEAARRELIDRAGIEFDPAL